MVDIDGYFAPPAAQVLSLYTLPPCRVIDTRNTTGPPIGSHGILQNIDTGNNIGAARLFEAIGKAALEESKKLREKEEPSGDASRSNK